MLVASWEEWTLCQEMKQQIALLCLLDLYIYTNKYPNVKQLSWAINSSPTPLFQFSLWCFFLFLSLSIASPLALISTCVSSIAFAFAWPNEIFNPLLELGFDCTQNWLQAIAFIIDECAPAAMLSELVWKGPQLRRYVLSVTHFFGFRSATWQVSCSASTAHRSTTH